MFGSHVLLFFFSSLWRALLTRINAARAHSLVCVLSSWSYSFDIAHTCMLCWMQASFIPWHRIKKAHRIHLCTQTVQSPRAPTVAKHLHTNVFFSSSFCRMKNMHDQINIVICVCVCARWTTKELCSNIRICRHTIIISVELESNPIKVILVICRKQPNFMSNNDRDRICNLHRFNLDKRFNSLDLMAKSSTLNQFRRKALWTFYNVGKYFVIIPQFW